MQRMALNLLDISRSEDGALNPKLAELELLGLATEVSGLMAQRAQTRQQTFDISPKRGPALVRADRELVQRVLENLLDKQVIATLASDGTRERAYPRTMWIGVLFRLLTIRPLSVRGRSWMAGPARTSLVELT